MLLTGLVDRAVGRESTVSVSSRNMLSVPRVAVWWGMQFLILAHTFSGCSQLASYRWIRWCGLCLVPNSSTCTHPRRVPITRGDPDSPGQPVGVANILRSRSAEGHLRERGLSEAVRPSSAAASASRRIGCGACLQPLRAALGCPGQRYSYQTKISSATLVPESLSCATPR